ncbi:MAG: hypothetical protein V4707_12730 [Pseudomonadota bacterium]
MLRLIELPGVRFLEIAETTGDRISIPGAMTARQYAIQIANVNFGACEKDLLPQPVGPDASENEFLRQEIWTEQVKGLFQSDWIGGDEALVGFFLSRGFDLTNDQRKLARCAPYFTRLIEAGCRGWLGPCPNTAVERWRRQRMFTAERPIVFANDYGFEHWGSGLEA